MAQAVTDETTELVSGTPIFNILNNVELPLVKSLGSSRIGAISFTSYFGPNVTEGLASIEKAESQLNNIACLGYENGDRVVCGLRRSGAARCLAAKGGLDLPSGCAGRGATSGWKVDSAERGARDQRHRATSCGHRSLAAPSSLARR